MQADYAAMPALQAKNEQRHAPNRSGLILSGYSFSSGCRSSLIHGSRFSRNGITEKRGSYPDLLFKGGMEGDLGAESGHIA